MHPSKKTYLIVLQPSSFCNINCRYCYLPERKSTDIFPEDLLEESIKKILRSELLGENAMFLWHSGEPLAVGINFYKKALELINQYNVQNKKIISAIQTNATLLNQSWCDFFKENSFQVGVSLDGPEFLHDKNRRSWNDKGTFRKVMQGVDYLRKNEIRLAAICVLTKDSLDYPDEIFNFFMSNNFSRLSFVLEETMGENKASSVNDAQNRLVPEETKQKFNSFISTIFKLWSNAKDKICIREFDELCKMIEKTKKDPYFEPTPPEVGDLRIITIKKNGDISTYDPELAGGIEGARDKFTIGNIREITELSDLLESPCFVKMQQEVHAGVKNCRNTCDYFKLCGARSPGLKMYETGSFASTETKYCSLFRKSMADVVINELAGISRNLKAAIQEAV